jgi:hypothetical protein
MLFHLEHGLGYVASGHLLRNRFVVEAKAVHAYTKNLLNVNDGRYDLILSEGDWLLHLSALCKLAPNPGDLPQSLRCCGGK